jgi:hypothetical protein
MPVEPWADDHQREVPGKPGNVIDLWGIDADWDARTDGALALAPEPREASPRTEQDRRPARRRTHASRLKARRTSGTVPRMATTEASGFAARTRQRHREEARARARRARRTAALVVVACGCLVALLLTAFGTGKTTATPVAGPASPERLLPAGPPQPQIVAMHEGLKLQLPVNQTRVTAIGYHAAGAGALPLDPVGAQANAGIGQRIVGKLFGTSESDVRYYLLEGGTGAKTSGLDVGAPVDTDVYAPVDGSIIAIGDNVVNGEKYGVRIDIQPSGNPGIVVTIENLRADPGLTVGSTVSAGRSKIGRIIDLTAVEEAGLARYTQDQGQHVHIELHPATALTTP